MNMNLKRPRGLRARLAVMEDQLRLAEEAFEHLEMAQASRIAELEEIIEAKDAGIAFLKQRVEDANMSCTKRRWCPNWEVDFRKELRQLRQT